MPASELGDSKYRNLWKPSLELGIPLIDGQHRNLVQHLEALFQAVEHGNSQDEIRSCFAFVQRYTNDHFNSEERLMRKHGFPGADVHVEAHARFRETVQKASKLILGDTGSDKALLLLESLLMNWFVEHIQGMDQMYFEFFRMSELLHLIEE